MADNAQAAATKQDIKLLMDEMGRLYDHIGTMKTELKTELKEEITQELKEYMDEKSKETHDYFNFYAGKLHKDMVGATEDVIQSLREKDENHKQRIIILEQKTGTIAVA